MQNEAKTGAGTGVILKESPCAVGKQNEPNRAGIKQRRPLWGGCPGPGYFAGRPRLGLLRRVGRLPGFALFPKVFPAVFPTEFPVVFPMGFPAL